MKHQFIQSEEDNFYLCSAIIEGCESVEAALGYISSDVIPSLSELNVIEDPFVKVDIRAKFGPIEFSEQTLWEEYAQSSTKKYVGQLREYVSAVAACCKVHGSMFERHEPISFGGSAIRRGLRITEFGHVDPLEFYSVFIVYLREVCDLNYETVEDSLIKRMLRILAETPGAVSNKSAWTELASFRLFNGQQNIQAQDARFLTELLGPRPDATRATFRPVLECVFQRHSQKVFPKDFQLMFLAAYGSNRELAIEVLNALEVGVEIELNNGRLDRLEDDVRREADFRIQSLSTQSEKLYTGYHILDCSSGEWRLV